MYVLCTCTCTCICILAEIIYKCLVFYPFTYMYACTAPIECILTHGIAQLMMNKHSIRD